MLNGDSLFLWNEIMVKVEVLYEGDLRTTATHGPSGNSFFTDAPLDNHGKAESFSPTDLVATALGTCILTVMGIYARRKDIPLQGSKVKVEKHMVTSPIRRIGKLVVDIHFASGIPEKERKIIEKIAFTCPVHQSIHPDIEVPVTFHYPD